jgi:hypothetical protein
MGGSHTIAVSAREWHAPMSWWPRHRKWVLPLGGVLLLAAGTTVACDHPSGPAPAHPSANAQPQKAPPKSFAPSPIADPPTATPLPPAWAADFGQFQAGLHAKIGVVLRPVGAGSNSQVTLGDKWTTGPAAWSTSKVPLVIAAMREQKTDQPTEQMKAAITESDNHAAESIWDSLGDPVTAAGKVQAVLSEAGDTTTTVQSKQVRPPYTAFGQTDWTLTNQAQFLSTAACDQRNKPVLDLMSKVESGQQWGLGVIPKTEIKGGWGPYESGRYLVRQIGIVPGPKGLTVVAIATEPESGSFDDGTRDLTEIAKWLQTHRDDLPGAQCKA